MHVSTVNRTKERNYDRKIVKSHRTCSEERDMVVAPFAVGVDSGTIT